MPRVGEQLHNETNVIHLRMGLTSFASGTFNIQRLAVIIINHVIIRVLKLGSVQIRISQYNPEQKLIM